MSTSGIVAVGTLAEWRGIYNHSDSYPTGLGEDLYEHVVRRLIEGHTLTDVGQAILMFDDWRNYLGGGICRYCGQIASQPGDISGDLYGNKFDGTSYPDPSCRNHVHTPLEQIRYEQYTSTSSWGSWLYIINPVLDLIHVVDGAACKDGGSWADGHVGDMDLKSPPNFQALECGEHFERCGHYAWAHFPELRGSKTHSDIGTRTYLGLEPLTGEDAYGVIIDGIEYRIIGGADAGFFSRIGKPLQGVLNRFRRTKQTGWYSSLKRCDDGTHYYAPLFKPVNSKGQRRARSITGVEFLFPTLKIAPEKARV